jgi:ElaB/YqjD/DUF883 family membrane-anchored ribosome-binding protein
MAVETNTSNQTARGGQDEKPSAISNPGGSIQEAMEASRGRLLSAYEAMQERSTHALEDAEGYIHNRPFQAVIYAASIGAVIGLAAGIILGSDRSQGSWYRRFW